MDISISNLPATNEQITLFSINYESEIYITHNGKICLFNDGKLNESKTILKLNEYIRLLIIVQKKYIEIYLNGLLQIRSNININQFTIKTNKIELFREMDLLMNTTNDEVLRIECKSITFLNRSIGSNLINEQMKSSNYSLVSLVAPPFQMIASSLIAIGYKEEWIKYAMKKYNTTNAQFIDTIIRENKEELLKLDNENERIRNLIILSRLNPMIDQETCLTDFDKDEDIGQLLFANRNNEQDNVNQTDENIKEEWYQQTVHGLHLPESFLEWMTELGENYQLLDLRKPEQQFTMITTEILNQRKTIQYSHKQHLNSRLVCEHGLISIYARNILLNILKIWLDNGSNLFPLEKLGDYKFIVKLLRLLDYHYTYKSTYIDENINRINLLIYSIIQVEAKELIINQITIQKEITLEILQSKAPLLYELQKDIINQSIRFLLKPSLLLNDFQNEETMIKEPNLNFIFKMLNLFVKLATDKSIMKQNEIDLFIPILFRVSFINLMFDLFLLLPTHQSKIFILRSFVT
jgi:hypothetical protein